mmetsp:Transcript_63756/g.132755  ORF Transcript_63756/g.132755 Transcript_63756/m.132755 type:complete len:2318 (-) Transcript_63756:166-7119(-)|eukprot:CAMPEP_0181303660 /NCGR_PEP_ID=MMETSP1101-20121128/8686_1 /TAXON_ID=46948 /ORGANISM="Rhodomonas abbreviata, Strain Caron Lab Isolate" /LENGTH=2317 /DNA_ID=CAMNT_0023409267 /DNA_START=339 /DNA_END=7292 /DNA_ORIENTATION=+
MWLERLQTLAKGEIWGGGQESEVKVNEGILNQLVSQGFDRTAAQAALCKTNNDDFAALLILTSPEDMSDLMSPTKVVGDVASDSSDEAKQQRFLDFFRDLGDQYWGWQNESAKRGRGFKGALKENFLPLLPDLRQLASEDLPFSSSPAIAYHALCFLNRGLDECPPANEDRDRDRHRMSSETAPIVLSLVKRIGALGTDSYGSSLVCELVKETFAVLDKLVVSPVSARLVDSARVEGVRTIVAFITNFYTFMKISQDNAGLPGASGKLSAVHLHPAIRSLSLFISCPTTTNAEHQREVAGQLGQLGEFLEGNDPSVVEAVLTSLSSFVQSFSRLSQPDCDLVLGPFLEVDGPIARRLFSLLATSSNVKIHGLVVSFLSSVCNLSGQVVEQFVGVRAVERMDCGDAERFEPTTTGRQDVVFDCVARALTQDGSQVRSRGVLNWIELLLSCITDGHKAQKKERTGVRLLVEDSEVHRRLSDAMVDADLEEMELREILDHDDLREDELNFRSRTSMDSGDRRRAELEIRLQRLRRAKISRIQEARMRRRFNAMGAEVTSSGEGSAAAGRSLTASPVCGRDLVSGTRVKRGPNWKWNSQDGGVGNEGVVVSGTEKNTDGWVRVKWDKGGVNAYRWSAENAYDVEPVDANPLSRAIREKDVTSLIAASQADGTSIRGTSAPLMEVMLVAEEGAPLPRDVEMMSTLIDEFGADPNKPSAGRLVLNVAAERARHDLVQALIDRGAEIDKKDAEGLTALQCVVRHLERNNMESSGSLIGHYGKVVRMLEDKAETTGSGSSPTRHFKFEKEGGQRSFGRSYPGFRFPSASCLNGNVSFTVSVRMKHSEPTGIRAGRSCLLCFGRASGSVTQGFSIMLHTHGHTQCGPGLCNEGKGCRINLAIARDRWAVLTCVYNSEDSSLTAFVDGIQRAQTLLSQEEQSHIVLDSAGDFLVGCPPEGADRDDRAKFHGIISDVRIYNKALSEEELGGEIYADILGSPEGAHPALRVSFSECMCKVLLDSLCRREMEGNVGKIRSYALHFLSRVLPFCSSELLASDMRLGLVRFLELSATNEASAAHTTRAERRSEASPVPSTMISVLRCIDSVMSKAPDTFNEPFRRSGLVAKIQNLNLGGVSGASSSGVSNPGTELQQDIAQYLVETYFGGNDGARLLPPSGQAVRDVLSSISSALDKFVAGRKDQGALGKASVAVAEARAALQELARLFQAGAGIFCEELIASGVSKSLLAFLDSGGQCAATAFDPFLLLESTLEASEGESALGSLVATLRLAADRLPLEHPEALSLLLAEPEHIGPEVVALKQWAVLNLEKGNSDKSARDLSGVEIQTEPLAFVKTLAATVEAMLEAHSSKWTDKNSRTRELRAMVHAFGDDPDGAPPSLLEHIKHLMVHEHRALDGVPPITRQFNALPPIHTWDRETSERGAVKQRLVLGKGNLLVTHQSAAGASAEAGIPHGDEDDGDERSTRFGNLSPREPPMRHRAPPAEGRSSNIRLRLRKGRMANERPISGSAKAAMSEFSFANEADAPMDLSPDGGEDCVVPSAGRNWLQGSVFRTAVVEQDSVDGDDSDRGVELLPDETIFEAMCRVASMASSNRQQQDGRMAHPGRFWEKNFVLSYSRACVDGEEEGDGSASGEKEVLVEVPKTVVRFITGRSGVGIRKIERESGASIIAPSRNEPEAVFRLSGSPSEVNEAVELIHASARAASSFLETRDGPMLARNPRSASGAAGQQQAAGSRSDDGAEGSSAASAHAEADAQAAAAGSGEDEEGLPGPTQPSTAKGDEAGQMGGVVACEDSALDLSFLGASGLQPCILLLHRLSRRFGSRFPGSDSFASIGIGNHIRRQLEDPLVVGSGMLSKISWVMELCKLQAVVPLAVRERCFVASALGASRALATCSVSPSSDQVPHPEEGVSIVRSIGQTYGMHFTTRPINQDLLVPQLVRETVEIDHRREGHEDKPSLLVLAEKVLEAHGARDSVLDVTWKGEAGHGAGPTRKFFEKVAALIEAGEEGTAWHVWRDVEDARRDGLFPAALPEDNGERTLILGRLRMVGLFMAKALQQGQMPGLCLAQPLFKLIMGEPLCFYDVKFLDKELYAGVREVVKWQEKRDTIATDQSLAENARTSGLEEFERNLSMMWDANGNQVTCQTLDSYVAELVQSCMAKFEIPEQVAALRDGISLVFPWKRLSLFQAAELQQKLWSDLQWDSNKLERIVRPGPMWPQEKNQIEWLRQEMMAMNMTQRRAFVKFVTASVCMPLEENPIVVHLQVAQRPGAEDWDKKLPTCRTCANYLYLPPYSTAGVLQQRLSLAMWEEHIAFD